MKTKFSELLKVKKQKVSEIEQKLAAKRHEKEVLLTQKVEIESQIASYALPQEGDFSAMQMALSSREYLFREKEQKEQMLEQINYEIAQLNLLYKEANIDYEKILHLHEVEQEKKLAQLLKEESKQMDEIANQLFTRKQTKGQL